MPLESPKRYRVLVPRLVDDANRNAQNLNAKAMLARFDDADFEWHVFHYGEPDKAVLRNPTVVCHRLWRGRLWPWHMISHYARGYDAVFYPGSEWFDAIGVRLYRRRFPQRKIIATLEGIRGAAAREEILSRALSRPVFCDRRSARTISYFDRVRNTADQIIAISPFLESIAHALYPAARSVLPLGYEPYDDDLPQAEPVNERPLILGAGTVYPRKRPEVFFDLAKQNPDADFVWYGDGPLLSPLQRKIFHG